MSESEQELAIPQDHPEQIAAEKGEITDAQRKANEQFQKQIEERQRRIVQSQPKVTTYSGGISARIQQAQAARANVGK